MAVRTIVHIDEDLCNGCGDCVPSCAEGAIQLIDGKARLVGDNLCDGLGACLGDCPTGAITVEEREADEFDEGAVKVHLEGLETKDEAPAEPVACGCAGSKPVHFAPVAPVADPGANGPAQASALTHWPVQLHLVSPTAMFFQEADLLLAADCTAFTAGDFHTRLLQGRSLVVACPKLDHDQDIYLQKLVSMIDDARINTLTIAIMEVPCCAGLEQLALRAAQKAGRKVPIKKIVLGVRGDVLSDEWL